ncbi:Cc8L18.2-like protein [Elysia marginata]|uniref:Cc8L18.2-like protein n=1 Tax=Elysia marginata TaxID=1093978 RepID=A0AAV4GGP4_9GAST|nr:Cc8L18.2-like protein [Elysia marginata]
MLGRGVEKSNCHATVSRVSSFQVDIGQAVFDLMGNLADARLLERQLRQPIPTTAKKEPKSLKERTADFYAKVKQDPEKHRVLLDEQKERSKRNREQFKLNGSDEEKERRRALNNERVKRWKERQKEAGKNQDQVISQQPLTRKQKEKEENKKKLDRDRKRNERSNWSTQKRAAVNKKARDKYHAKKSDQDKDEDGPSVVEIPEEDSRSWVAHAMAITRLKKALPKNSLMKQATITDFMKQHEKTEKETEPPQCLSRILISEPGTLNTKENLQLKRLISKKLQFLPNSTCINVQRELGLRTDQVQFLAAKANGPLKRNKKKLVSVVVDIHAFFGDNSRFLQLKKKAARNLPFRVLERTLKRLYKEYIQTGRWVSFPTFCRYQPKNVKKQDAIKFNQALCEFCENLDLKIKAVKAGTTSFATNQEDLIEKILCSKNGPIFLKDECVRRTCEICGQKKVSDLVDNHVDCEKIMEATLHPIVCYYRCQHCSTPATESIVIISDDLVHDAVAVQVFTKAAFDHLQAKIKVSRLIQFTDGCAAQYKSKLPFWHIQNSPSTLGLPIERNFFESRHGKNPSDGESAVVKNAATRAVKSRQAIIQTATDLYQFGLKNLEVGQEGCTHYIRRKFIYVASGTVEEQRKIARKAPTLKTLKGTREVHAIKATKDGLVFRNASCYCDAIPCSNGSYVDKWKQHTMQETSKGMMENPTDVVEQSAGTQEELTQVLMGPHAQSQTIPKSPVICTPSVESNPPQVLLEQHAQSQTIPKSPVICTPSVESNPPQVLLEQHAQSQTIPKSPVICTPSVESNPPQVLLEQHSQSQTIPKSPVICTPSVKSNPPQGKGLFPGAWVAATFPGKVSKNYLGMVLEVDGNEAMIKFCRQHGKHFTWPKVDDISWMPFYNLTPVESPCIDGREKMSLDPSTFLELFN